MGNLFKKLIVLLGAGVLINKIIQIASELDMNNKVVLITGGSRGLGLVMARQLAMEGARIVICSRDEQDLSTADPALNKDQYMSIACDITDKEQVRKMISEVRDKWGAIDVLINNAGIIQAGPYESMTHEDFEQAMQTHFWGPYNTISEVVPYMYESGGRIVNISSIGGKISFPHLIPYNASKYALAGFSEGITAELREKNIKVTTVYPGLMRTGSPRNIQVKGQHEKEYAWFKISDSIPGLSMNAEEAAKEIITAMKRGRKTLTLTFPAKLAIAVHGISPGLNITIFDLINRILPATGPGGEKMKRGYESKSKASESFITKKTDKAAQRNNEL